MTANPEPLTIADLDAIPEDGNRYELIEGDLIVSRAPSLRHQEVAGTLFLIFSRYLELNPMGKIYFGPGTVLSEISAVIPDLAYVSNKQLARNASGDRIEGIPDLLIEVLSSGTENSRRDRHLKRHLYSKHGVREYWVIDHELLTVEGYRGPRLSLASTLGLQDKLDSPVLPGF